MPAYAAALERLLLAVWVGAALGIGYVAAPVLFARLEDPSVAGTLAGAMFHWMGWVGLVSGAGLLWSYRQLLGRWRSWRSLVVGIMLVATALIQFVLAPAIAAMRALPPEARDGFGVLHGGSSALYLLASVLGLWLLLAPPGRRD